MFRKNNNTNVFFIISVLNPFANGCHTNISINIERIAFPQFILYQPKVSGLEKKTK